LTFFSLSIGGLSIFYDEEALEKLYDWKLDYFGLGVICYGSVDTAGTLLTALPN